MKQILVAVDETKSARKTITKMVDVFGSCVNENITLLFVEKMESAMLDELLLSNSEIDTLRESLQGTEYQEKLDEKAEGVLGYYHNFLKEKGAVNVRTMKREGHPAEEILAAAGELQADLIVIGSRSKRMHNIFLGSVSREVVNSAECSVLILR